MEDVTTVLFGAGNFQRGFAAWMMSRLREAGHAVGRAAVVRPTPGGKYETLEAQDWRYHVWTRGQYDGATVDSVELVDVIAQAVYPYQDWYSYLALAEVPTLHTVISNTTEAGIVFDPADRREEEASVEFPGKLTAFLYARYRWAEGDLDCGLDVLPCELIADNGAALAACVRQYVELWELGAEFQRWIDEACTFTSTLVDRIVPGLPLGPLNGQARFADAAAVCVEPYHSWLLEDAPERVLRHWRFAEARLNVRSVPDLAPYRALKVRLLNAVHTMMVPVGLTHGIETVRAFRQNPTWGPWLEALMYEDVAPTLLDALPAAEVEAFAKTTLERFDNPFLHHRLQSIALNAESKWRTRVGEVVAWYTERGLPIPGRIREAWAAQQRLDGQGDKESAEDLIELASWLGLAVGRATK